MEALIYFLLFAGLFAITMRIGCGAHVLGHRHGKSESGDQTHMTTTAEAKDPVCGMMVEPTTAKTSMYAGRTHYFCSARCRDKFEASPASYINPESAGIPGMEESHGTQHH